MFFGGSVIPSPRGWVWCFFWAIEIVFSRHRGWKSCRFNEEDNISHSIPWGWFIYIPIFVWFFMVHVDTCRQIYQSHGCYGYWIRSVFLFCPATRKGFPRLLPCLQMPWVLCMLRKKLKIEQRNIAFNSQGPPKTEETDGPAVISSKKPLAWKKSHGSLNEIPRNLKKNIANDANKKNICKLKDGKKSWDFRENFWKDPNKKPQKPRWSYFPPQRRKKWPSYLLEIQDGFPMSRCFSRTRRSTPCGHRKPRPASKTRGPASWEKCLNISETNPYLDPVFLGKPQKENRAESNNEQHFDNGSWILYLHMA